MNDAVVRRHHAEVSEAEVVGILFQRVDLLARDGVFDGLVLVVGRRVVVRHTIDSLRAEALQAPGAQAGESLRAGDLVAIEAVDVELCGTVVDDLDDVTVPYFVKESFCHVYVCLWDDCQLKTQRPIAAVRSRLTTASTTPQRSQPRR